MNITDGLIYIGGVLIAILILAGFYFGIIYGVVKMVKWAW